MRRNFPVGILLTVLIFVAGCASRDALERSGADTVLRPDGSPPVTNTDSEQRPTRASASAPSCPVDGEHDATASTGHGYRERGLAYWYEAKSTSTGAPFDRYAMTAAHRTLPLSSYAEVTNLSNNRSVIVKIDDCSPFNKDRLIDLSYAAAAKLGMLGHGTCEVEVRAIDTNAASKDPNQNPGVQGGN